MVTDTTTYLVLRLRLHLGDITTPFRYLDEWLELALNCSIETLESWWNFKYLIDNSENIYRNPNGLGDFLFPEPPVIQRCDIKPIILMAAIIIRTGSLETFSWNVGAWRDAEISYTNIEGGREKDALLTRDWNELTNILKPPQKRLVYPYKKHLPGYMNNPFET